MTMFKQLINKISNKTQKIMKKKYTQLIIIGISLLIFTPAIITKQYNMALFGIMILWIYNIVFGLCKFEKRFIFLLMNVMIFTFILDRPLISALSGKVWWYFSEIAVCKALIAIYVTEIFLLLGYFVTEIVEKKYNMKNKTIEIKNDKIVKYVLLGIFVISGIISFYVEITKFINMKNLDYALIYTAKMKEFPLIIRTITSIFPYVVFAYLATLPNKKNSIIVLLVYIIIAIPSFLLGGRNALILRIIFSIVYILIRNFNEKGNNIWIHKQTKIIFGISIPIIVLFLGAYNYIRDDQNVENKSPIYLITDFFYKQGTTFDTICEGFEYEDTLKKKNNVDSYTFGDIIDYAKHSTISQKLFHTESLGAGNSITMVEKSNSMAHRLSYLVLGEESYLAGHGRGTSYIIETYMDAGMLGIAIYSFIIGMYLSLVIYLVSNCNYLLKYIGLATLAQLFILPRYSASGFISFIVTFQFWSIVILVYLIKIMMNKIKIRGKIIEK